MTAIRPEYPRPHFDRSHSWVSLNGTWDFFADPDNVGAPTTLDSIRDAQPISVPFAWETEASGVGAHWLEHAWYRRTFAVPESWRGQRVIAHFGAVHHRAAVWVDGAPVGEHEGGYTPFELDITDALTDFGAATLVVSVEAPTDKRDIAHGKQRSIPRDDYDDCAFTPSSGIWQSVWLEARPATYLDAVSVIPDSLDSFHVRVEIAGAASSTPVTVTIEVDGEPGVELAVTGSTVEQTIPIREPRVWSPADPHLYGIRVRLDSAAGTDEVRTHSGLRTIRTHGRTLLLNGEPLYVRGVLDQGYWPRTGITAPDDRAFVTDLELARECGFNLVRKHLKLEDPRFLHHADRLGMLVWAEPASTGRWSQESAARFDDQIEPMVRRDANHPSIVIWGLYNEEWGLDWDVPNDPAKQEAVRRAFRLLKALDPSRPAVDNSGWSHVETDLVDWHIYDETPAGWADKVAALLDDDSNSFPVGLGPGRVVTKLLMATGDEVPADRPNLNSEFGGGKTSVERGWNLRWQTLELRRRDRLAGYVWTELYDVEHEMAGIYDIDRSLKDTGGTIAAQVNADTVIVPELQPRSPGVDLVAVSRRVEFEIRVSHHGAETLAGELALAWLPHLAEAAAIDPRNTVVIEPIKVEPFRLSEPVRVSAVLPDGLTSARMALVLRAAGEIVSCTVVDVTS